MIGEKFEQSKKLSYILDNIKNCEIHFIKNDSNLINQIEIIQTGQTSSTTNIIYEIQKSNNQLLESVINQFKNVKNFIFPLIFITSNDQFREEAIKMKRKLYQNSNVQIWDLEEYFQKHYYYDIQIDLNGKKIAMFISKEQDIKNKVFQTIKSPALLLNDWALINTPQFNMNSEIEQKIESIKQFKQIFKKYQDQISLLFIIVDQERNDIVKQNFTDIYSQFKKFKKQIIVLLYNRFDEQFEQNSTLNNYFMNLAKIRKVYSLSNTQLQDQNSIDEYFKKILDEQQTDLEIGIDMKDTIFEARDETQSEIDKHTFELTFFQDRLKYLQDIFHQDDQELILYKKKIVELEKLKIENLNQIRQIEREISKKQRVIEKIQKETQLKQQTSTQVKISQKQGLQITNDNQGIVNKKDEEFLRQEIQKVEKQIKSLTDNLEGCIKNMKMISQKKLLNRQVKKSQEQEQQLELQIEDLQKNIEEINTQISERNHLLEKLKQDLKKNQQNLQQTTYVSNHPNSAKINKTSSDNQDYQGNR